MTLPPDLGSEQTVVLLHGQGRTRLSLAVLRRRLDRAGFRTLTFGYAGATSTLDRITARLLGVIRTRIETPAYHLVGHSLGCVVIRNGFRAGYPSGLRRVAMLAPPNRPAELAASLRRNRLYRVLTGEPGQLLSDEEFYRTLPIPPVPFGVIAGDRCHTGLFDEPSDGVVTVEGTKLAGMADWVVVHHTHTFLMNGRDTFELVAAFLRTGAFPRAAERLPGQIA
jgi:triacylglycerol lipase